LNKQVLAVGIVVLVVAVGAGGWLATHKDKTATTTPATQTTQSGSEKVTVNRVNISDFAFSASKLTIKKGSSVTWVNKDSAAHTVTSDTGSVLDSDTLRKDQTYTVTFNSVGTFAYHCKFHTGMVGSIVVTE